MELSPILNIDVGGQRFRVLRETVMRYPHSLLAQVITGKDTYNMLIADGAYFFDRNPQYFTVVLDYMRIGKIFLPPSLLAEQLKEELVYWRVQGKEEVKPVVQSEATLVIPEFEQTLIVPTQMASARIEPTLLIDPYQPTLLIEENTNLVVDTPNIEPTLLLEEPSVSVEISEKKSENPLKNSMKSIKSVTNSHIEPKKDFKKFDLGADDLLSSVMPETINQAARTLPWANKDNKKPAVKMNQVVSNQKVSEKVQEKKDKIMSKNAKDESESGGYESSFIDDDDLSISSGEFKPGKRKSTVNSQPSKKIKAANNCKKANLPSMEELSNVLKKKK